MKKVANPLLAGLLSLAFISLAACSDDAHKEKHPQDMLRVDIGAEVPTLDPQLEQDTASARVSYDLFSGLVDFDQENKPIPGMATHWETSTDGKKITFYLRKNLKFSDETPITAHDFVYSWKRLIDPETGSAYSYLLEHVKNGQNILNGKMSKESLGVFALNNDTFVVTLDEPDNTLIQKCMLPNLAVVPQKVIQKFGQRWTQAKNIVTSGAYILRQHVMNGYILAEKNPYYYDAASVRIPKVKYFPYEDSNAALAAYQSNGVDITSQAGPVDRYPEIKREYPTELHTIKQESIYYYDFNMTLPEFRNNIKLRQALSMAINREVISRVILKSFPAPLYSIVTPTIAGGEYTNIQYSWAKNSRAQQIAQAKKLYEEAGYGPNNPLKLKISFNTNDGHQKIALAIGAMWKETLGVQTTIQNQEWKTFINSRTNGNYVIARDGWAADYNAVDTYLILYECNSMQNNAHSCIPEYDKLVNQGERVLDSESQKLLYQQALKMALENYSTIPIFQPNYSHLVKPYVKGYDINHNYLDHVQSKWMYFLRRTK